MGFLDWFDDGMSMVSRSTRLARMSARSGLKRANRRKGVNIDKTCLVSPLARINARGAKLEVGANCEIAPYTILQGNVCIGKNSSVQAFSIIVGYGDESDPVGKVTIGNDVRIASHCMILGANHRFDDTSVPIRKQGLIRKDIVIEDDVWIAGRVNIIAGVHIGRGSVIAAGAVVTHDVPPYSVVAGVPARVIKKRKEDESL